MQRHMLLPLLLACATEPAPTVSPVAPTPPAPSARTVRVPASLTDLAARAADIDVVLISMDCLRYDRTGLAAGNEGRTPNLEALAASSVVFHDAMSPAAWTVPAHMAVFSGRWPTRHGLVNKLAPDPADPTKMVDARVSDDVPLWSETLMKAGWLGAAYTGDAGVSARFGYGRGFSAFVDDKKFGGMDHSGPPAVAWLQENKDGRLFLFFHGYDVHGQAPLPADVSARSVMPGYAGPMDGSIEEQAKLREQALATIQKPGQDPTLDGVVTADDWAFLLAIYDKKAQIADARMAQVVQTLKDTGVWDHAIVALMSDHGEEFGEHGSIDHGYSLYQEQLHVPMMLHFPGQTERVDVRETVRTIDLFPTIFDALGLPPVEGSDGASLLPFLNGEADPPGPLLAETDYRLYAHLRAIRKGDLKLILDLEDGTVQLFDLAKDPGEKTDLAKERAREASELEQELRGHLLGWRTDATAYLGRADTPIPVY